MEVKYIQYSNERIAPRGNWPRISRYEYFVSCMSYVTTCPEGTNSITQPLRAARSSGHLVRYHVMTTAPRGRGEA